ncbi:hypothetical protein AHAS_Ahas10G0133400 [Arachis hypogaea]
MTTDQRPTVIDRKKIIPHGNWPGPELALGRRSRQKPAPSIEARPSTLVPLASAPTDAAPPTFLVGGVDLSQTLHPSILRRRRASVMSRRWPEAHQLTEEPMLVMILSTLHEFEHRGLCYIISVGRLSIFNKHIFCDNFISEHL